MNVQNSLRRAHTSSVLFSVLVNAALLALLLTLWSGAENVPTPSDTVIQYVDPGDPPPPVTTVDPPPPDDAPDPQRDPDPGPDIKWNMEEPPSLGAEEPPQPAPAPEPLPQAWKVDTAGPVVMRELMFGRTEVGRKEALRRHGQGLEGVSEPAVMRALRWLQANQRSDGSWGAEGKRGDPGHTGLALLAFLAHGETFSSREFGVTVANGIRFLVENQDSRGLFQPAGRHEVYSQAMATYALAEALAMTGHPILESPLRQAVEVILRHQHPGGGFEYEYQVTTTHDVSVDAWHVQALKAASVALPEDREIGEAMRRTMEAMLSGSVEDRQGRGFGYRLGVSERPRPEKRREILSAAGLLGMYLSGKGERSETREILKFVERHAERDRLPEWGVSRIGSDEYGGELMFWYYAVQAFFQEDRDGTNFKKFYPAMVEALVSNQAADGHWQNFSRESPEQGRVVDTSLGALGLMVTYRYLSTSTRPDPGPATGRPPEDEVEFRL